MRNAFEAQEVSDYPAENVTCPLTGNRLLKQVLGRAYTGNLHVGRCALSTGIPLMYRNRAGTKPKPKLSVDLDRSLYRFVIRCQHKMSCIPGQPRWQRLDAAGVWLICTMPLGRYEVEREPGQADGAILYRIMALMRRPRGTTIFRTRGAPAYVSIRRVRPKRRGGAESSGTTASVPRRPRR